MTPGTPGRYHIWTIGCQMNEADTRRLASRLEALGWRPAEHPQHADWLILNSCVVRQQAEDKVYGQLERARGLKQKRLDMHIAVMGCLVGRKTDALQRRFPFVTVFMPPSDFTPLLEHLARAANSVPALPCSNANRLPERMKNRIRANVPAVLGCSHACTYCVIPYRRGRERSRPPEEILAEIQTLAAEGVREVVLLGQIVDRYGIDLGTDYTLARLLREAAGVEGILRIRFLTSHPSYLTDTLLDAVAEEPKICPHFEVPFQSGSDAVLERMRRGYTADQYRDVVARIRTRVPEAAVHTDIIVGFPGETESDVQDSLRLLEELQLDKAHIARYSPRPQTWAARRLVDDVPPEEKERRRVLLDTAQTRILTEKNASRLETVVEVLPETRDSRSGRLRGRTPDDRLVFFDGPDSDIGHIVPVRITWTGPFSLVGAPEGKARFLTLDKPAPA